jgi:hypothetical protein
VTDDLTTRLRGIAEVFFEFHEDDQADVLADAADEIDRLAAQRQAVLDIHQPVDEEVEIWDEEDLDHDVRFPACPGGADCNGHLVTIQVCSECGYDHDGEQPTFRAWPCPTVRRLNYQSAPNPEPTGRNQSPITRADFAQATGLAISTVDRLIAEGKVCAVKAGRRVLIPAGEPARFIAAARTEAPGTVSVVTAREFVVLPMDALLEFFGEVALPPWIEHGEVIGTAIDCAPIATRISEWIAAHDLADVMPAFTTGDAES